MPEPLPLPGRGRLRAQSSPLAPTWHRLDSCVRRSDDEPRSFRTQLAAGEGALVYLCLGSLGSADVELMKRLVDVLARDAAPLHRLEGPAARPSSSSPTTCGARSSCRSPRSCPLVDLVITHGGNNTTTECFHFGKPMIVLPLFWDQYDNAQRVARDRASGSGSPTYEFEDGELLGAIDRLLADEALRSRMAGIAARVQAAPGTEKSGRSDRAARTRRLPS